MPHRFGSGKSRAYPLLSWQGWVAMAVLLAVAAGAQFIQLENYDLPEWTRTAVLGLLAVIFVMAMLMTLGSRR